MNKHLTDLFKEGKMTLEEAKREQPLRPAPMYIFYNEKDGVS